MKKGLFFLVFVLYSVISYCIPCMGTILLKNQSDVNAFELMPCDSILMGQNLEIIGDGMGDDIMDLSPLSALKYVDGLLMIRDNPSLMSLAGLENIDFAWSVIIDNNLILSDINALKNLNIGTAVSISTNPNLSQCCAFQEEVEDGVITFILDDKNPSQCSTEMAIAADNSCLQQAASVPTLGQWAVLQLAILFMIIGVITLTKQEKIMELG